METKIKPPHFSDDEWSEYIDIAESDAIIPPEQYGEYIQPILEDISLFAEVRGVEVPTIVIEISSFSYEDRYAFAWWIGGTKYQLQQWQGEQKEMIFRQMR